MRLCPYACLFVCVMSRTGQINDNNHQISIPTYRSTLSGCQGHMVARGTYNELQGSGLDFTSLLTEEEVQEEEKQDPNTIAVYRGHHDNSASSLSSLSSSQHSLFDGGESQVVVGISETRNLKNLKFQACFS